MDGSSSCGWPCAGDSSPQPPSPPEALLVKMQKLRQELGELTALMQPLLDQSSNAMEASPQRPPTPGSVLRQQGVAEPVLLDQSPVHTSTQIWTRPLSPEALLTQMQLLRQEVVELSASISQVLDEPETTYLDAPTPPLPKAAWASKGEPQRALSRSSISKSGGMSWPYSIYPHCDLIGKPVPEEKPVAMVDKASSNPNKMSFWRRLACCFGKRNKTGSTKNNKVKKKTKAKGEKTKVEKDTAMTRGYFSTYLNLIKRLKVIQQTGEELN
ncbi:uncharacterized protein LOC118386656 [Oncorhynchus keta]|uniref:uncharacterized protein LOC118386656 n=1 Tax=Oncorhynchus keta TaxID=8018 RepID=UPI0015FE26CE|nr:uncharacterized protein LOC118386656 [Oncorhynchus keta]XP_052382314.1 uncharacterized protein LOC118386656 [Oncorhynchus keta]XP_052382325.1 uncharacterized protein LOC118386656 [Oncorhynchus keta]XP_052382330.1 uncharacterized protein LOC118386656 [Oncorhynchus keta]XP_052382337.1 uncharacterized protein LOC118386656 [Oncorhynchus keta]XP_052382339.1 uncharacterized protein LOC118386656 [Oncorhynchus keta]XP_052382343.1 uncharacterized protein LOC118386656 [Oncorhynchus keta]